MARVDHEARPARARTQAATARNGNRIETPIMERRCANALCALVSKLTCASYELDERFHALQCRDDPGEFSVETAQQVNPTSTPDSYPNDGRAVVQKTVDGEVFVFRDG